MDINDMFFFWGGGKKPLKINELDAVGHHAELLSHFTLYLIALSPGKAQCWYSQDKRYASRTGPLLLPAATLRSVFRKPTPGPLLYKIAAHLKRKAQSSG